MKKIQKSGRLAVWFAAGLASITATYLFVIRPWLLRWGATQGDTDNSFQGDDLVPHPAELTTRAITIFAPAAKIWPWLLQLGQGRGGFYSYDGLENLFGLNIHTIFEIKPELQDLKAGDPVPFWEGGGVQVAAIQTERALVLSGPWIKGQAKPSPVAATWAFYLEPVSPSATRLVVRTRLADTEPAWLGRLFFFFLLEPAHFIMERKMLLTIEALAEGRQPPPLVWQIMRRMNQRSVSIVKAGKGPKNLVLLLTTTGRKSGQPRQTPLQFEEQGGVYYVGSARGQQADWFRNLVADPKVVVQVKGDSFPALAKPVTDPQQIADFLELRLQRHPAMVRAMLLVHGLPPTAGRPQLEKLAGELAIVALQPVKT